MYLNRYRFDREKERFREHVKKLISAKLVPKSKLNRIKMLLVYPLLLVLIFLILIVYWTYDKHSDLRKRFKGYRNVAPEPFEIKKHNAIIYGPSNSGKTTFIKDYCGLYETVNLF